ncbi:MAG TPA: TAXI family TRAP transporter solute-binding subunit, partial [Geminicoccaceae bacterium]|nr:TAXI family TRAP transporter solute-binding subunit [Geminicoccaceae bacterium]
GLTFFRIGTGGVTGTYYPVGGLIADAISNPPGGRPCERGGSCGVPGLIAVAQSSTGSVANVEAVAAGELESGFAQSDVAYWAYTGTGVFAGEEPAKNLRAIAGLYPESIHLVARRDAGIESVRDLAGKRVSLDEPGSGTLVDARIILGAYGLSEKDLQASYVKANVAIGMLQENTLDAFFIVAGYPTASVAELAEAGAVALVPIDGPEAEALVRHYGFFEHDVVPAGTYRGIGATETMSVGSIWLVGAQVDEKLVYDVTAALWHPNARRLLDGGHAKGREITLATALSGVSVPLHPGAERYYRELDMLPPATLGEADAARSPGAATPAAVQ